MREKPAVSATTQRRFYYWIAATLIKSETSVPQNIQSFYKNFVRVVPSRSYGHQFSIESAAKEHI